MDLLTLKSHKVTPSPYLMQIKAFKAIWKRDRSVDNVNALEDLAFIYYFCDFRSPYMQYDEERRYHQLFKDVIGEKRHAKWKLDDEMKEAIDKYNELQETPTLKLLRAATTAINKYTSYFETIDLSEKDDRGKLVHNSKDLASNIKSVGDLINSIEVLHKKVMQEVQTSTRIYGGGQLGDYEDATDIPE